MSNINRKENWKHMFEKKIRTIENEKNEKYTSKEKNYTK